MAKKKKTKKKKKKKQQRRYLEENIAGETSLSQNNTAQKENHLTNLADIWRHFRSHSYIFLFIAVFCFFAYVNILDNAFVSDDISGIVNNQDIGRPLNTLRAFFSHTPINNQRVLAKNLLGVLMKDAICLLAGKSVFAYHFFSVFLHVLVCFSVYFFLLLLVQNQTLSTFATFIFALHPIHSETVAWISATHYLIYSLFFLISFIFFHFYLENREKRYILACIFFYGLCLFFNIWALPLGAIFFLYEILIKKNKPTWLFYGVLLMMVTIYLFSARGTTTARIDEMSQGIGAAFRNPLITIPHSLTQYVYLLIWPIKLSLYHEGEILTPAYIWVARFLSLALLLVLPFIFRKKKLFIFFLLFFLISISICLSPIQVAWYVAERYVYLGSISFCVLLAALFLWLEKKTGVKNLAMLLLMTLLSFYFVRTVIRGQDWQSRASLWIATERVAPRSPRVHNNLGDIYGGQGNHQMAIKEFEKARELQPGYADATHNLGHTYLVIGDMENAKKYFLEAAEYNPILYQSYFYLGVISFNEDNKDAAQRYFEKALSINPHYREAQKAIMLLE